MIFGGCEASRTLSVEIGTTLFHMHSRLTTNTELEHLPTYAPILALILYIAGATVIST